MFKSRSDDDCGYCAIGCLGVSRRAIEAVTHESHLRGMTVRQLEDLLRALGFTVRSSFWIKAAKTLSDTTFPPRYRWIVLLYEPGCAWGHWVYVSGRTQKVHDSDYPAPLTLGTYLRAGWLVRCWIRVGTKKGRAPV